LFLPLPVGRGHRCFGHILVAGCLGKVGDRCRGCDPGYYEPFLPGVLLPEHEKSRGRSCESLGPKSVPEKPFSSQRNSLVFLTGHQGELGMVLDFVAIKMASSEELH
jgi:hypothetical protein